MSVTASNSAGPRIILLASPRSFCAGVERAVAVVEQLLDQRGGPIFVRKQIVHNTHVHVVADLQARGAVFVDELEAVPDGAMVVWLHGVGVVGLTAGASAPPPVVEAVIAVLSEFGPATVIERETTRETVHFTLPSIVHPP